MAAKLPESLVEAPRRTIADLAVGEKSYALHHAMKVTTSGDCYLAPTGVLVKTRGDNRIVVERRSDGYHVTVIAKGTAWIPGDHVLPDAIPVASTTEEYDPDLDAEAKLGRLERLIKRRRTT
jgi:hypothetical protein